MGELMKTIREIREENIRKSKEIHFGEINVKAIRENAERMNKDIERFKEKNRRARYISSECLNRHFDF